MSRWNWIELAGGALVLAIFRDRILFALAILFLPRSWNREALQKAIRELEKRP